MTGFWAELYLELYTARTGVLLSWSTLFVVAAIPGPTAMAIMGIGMDRGKKASLLFTTGCMLSSSMWGIAAAFGLSAWLLHFAEGFLVLKLLGGAYLLWMAYKAARSAFCAAPVVDISLDKRQSRNLFLHGVLMHATNPKAIFGWAAALTLSQTETNSVNVLVFTLLGCLLITYSVHYAYALTFASRAAQNFYIKARRRIQGVLAVIFGYAGYRLITY